jgi:hypothetical protein
MYRAAGLGGVETQDNFISSVSAQLVDEQGDVIFSGIGHDHYKLSKVAGQGLNTAQAEEIAMKNATGALARAFIDQVRLEPREFKLSKVEDNRLWVPGLSLPEGETVDFEVLRPLAVKVNGRGVVRRLAVAAGAAAPVADGATVTVLAYAIEQGAQADDKPRAGDLLRVPTLPRAGQQRLSECHTPYQAPAGTVAADHLLPLLRHASYGSSLHQLNVASEELVAEANALLQDNLFSTRLKAAPQTETCLRAAYIVKQEPLKCASPTSCATQIKVSPAALLNKAGTRVATYSLTDALNLEGFSEPEAANFIGFKAYEHVRKMLPTLSKSLNIPR